MGEAPAAAHEGAEWHEVKFDELFFRLLLRHRLNHDLRLSHEAKWDRLEGFRQRLLARLARFHVFTCRILGERFATLPPLAQTIFFAVEKMSKRSPEWILGNCDLPCVKCVHPETDWIVFDIAASRETGETVALALDTTLLVPTSSDLRSHCVEMSLQSVSDAVQREANAGHLPDDPPFDPEIPAVDAPPPGDGDRRSARPESCHGPGGLPAGLANAGTACFLNSVLVCLAHLKPCGETLSAQTPTTDLGALLRRTVVSLRQLQDTAVPMSALHNLIQSHFGILGQEDASVLLRTLLHALPSHLECGAQWPWHGTVGYQWRSPLDGDQADVTDMGVLALPRALAPETSIQDLLAAYFGWTETGPPGTPSRQRRARLVNLPACLAVSLHQGAFDPATGRVCKCPQAIRLTRAI